MMSALNLLWIIPLSACFGYGVSAIFVTGVKSDWEDNLTIPRSLTRFRRSAKPHTSTQKKG
jgi:hypothetical protein